jgi:hypothetical protein
MLGKLLVVGTTRDCEATLEKNVNRIARACRDFEEVSFYVVESDSKDATKDILFKLHKKIPNFNYTSLGFLDYLIPERVDRIRFCRNNYIDYLKNRQNSTERCDFVLVVDLDRVNSKLSRRAVISCFSTNEHWDACFANQSFGYYDLYALRAENWITYDIFKELRSAFSKIPATDGKWPKVRSYFIEDRLRKNIIYNNMRRIPSNHSWIKVRSAFGGAAIYRADVLSEADYSAIDTADKICEHVDLNLKLYNLGKNLWIVPSFINCRFNAYNLNRIKLVRFLRALKNLNNMEV